MKDEDRARVWHVGKDDVGRPVLLWDTSSSDSSEISPEEHDPLAQTFNFLKRLDVPDLGLAVEVDDGSRDPYDSDG